MSDAGARADTGVDGGGATDAAAASDGGDGGTAGCLTTGSPLPTGAGVLNVKDFGATGDGTHDDTDAISRAIAKTAVDLGTTIGLDNIVYFPEGTYLVTGTLQKKYPGGGYASGMLLIGASRCAVTIKLADHAAGFGDPAHPKAVIYTSSKLIDPGSAPQYPVGGGNDAYLNYVQHLTVDVGTGNPGAEAINYISNNIGSIRDVTVRAPSGEGAVGIDMTRRYVGPTLLDDVIIDGFDVGLATANTEYGIALEHLTLVNQRSVALRNDRNMVALHDLVIRTSGVAIDNAGADGLITIQHATIEATGKKQTAVKNAGAVALMQVEASGFESFLGQSQTAPIDGVFQGVTRTSDFGSRFTLTAEEPPETPKEPPSSWASVTDFGARPDLGTYADLAYPSSGCFDSSAGIQAALNSGKSTIYFPHGIYYFTKNFSVPQGVRHIVGVSSTLRAANGYDSADRLHGILRFQNTSSSVLVEHLQLDNANLGFQVGTEVSGAGAVVLQDVRSSGVVLLVRHATGGPVFLSNAGGTLQIAGPAPVFARHLNIEFDSSDVATGVVPPTGPAYSIINKGSPLWVLGMKTEQPIVALDNQPGAVTNILGGLFYMVKGSPPPTLFQSTDSAFAASFVEESFSSSIRYTTYLKSTKAGIVTSVPASNFPQRLNGDTGRVVPLLAN